MGIEELDDWDTAAIGQAAPISHAISRPFAIAASADVVAFASSASTSPRQAAAGVMVSHRTEATNVPIFSSSLLFDDAIIAEFYGLRDLALPVFVSYLMSFGLQIVSQMVVGRVSAAALASVALANMFANATGLAPIIGTANACDTLCSESFGVGNFARVGKVARRGLGVALSTATAVAFLWFFAAGAFFRAMEIEPELADMAQHFIRILILGLPAQVLSEVLKKPLISMQMASTATALSCAGLATSALLCAPLVFNTSAGYLGAAYATVIAHWVTASCFVSFLRWHRQGAALIESCVTRAKKRLALSDAVDDGGADGIQDTPVVITTVGEGEGAAGKEENTNTTTTSTSTTTTPTSTPLPCGDWHDTLDAVFPPSLKLSDFFEEWGEYLSLGLPSASMLIVEWGTFEALAVVAGRLGRVQLATHSLIATTAAMNFMPFLGISVAACVRVGSAMGDLRPLDAQRTLRVALFLCVIVAICNALLALLCRSVVGRVFTDDPAVVDLTARIIPILAVYFIFDGMQCVLSGVMRGAALAGTAAGINAAAYFMGILFAVGLSDPRLQAGAHWGLSGIWFAFLVAVFIASLAMMSTLQCTKWEKLAQDAHTRGKNHK